MEMNIDIERIIEIIKNAKEFFENKNAIESVKVKGVADYATLVDYSVQKYLQEEFEKLYPEIGFLGEEDYSGESIKGYTWIVDPVDGTTNLIHNYRESAVSVALSDGERIVLGVIYNPYTDDVYYAKRGSGAYRNGELINVSKVKDMQHSLISIGTSPYNHEYAEENFKIFKKIFLQCEDIRRCGSAALDLVRVASGQCEAYFERNLKIWDYAAGMLLIEEAGGMVTNFCGKPIGMEKANNIVAGNADIAQIIVEQLM